MFQNICSTVFTILISFSANAINLLKGVESAQENGKFVAIYEFMEPVEPSLVQTSVQDKILQVIIPNSEMPTDKNSLHVGKNGVIGVDSNFEEPDMIRSNISFDHAISSAVQLKADANKLKIYISNEVVMHEPAKPQKESEIPVLAAAKTQKKVDTKNPLMKLLMSLMLIAIFSGGIIYFSKWYKRNHKKSVDTNKIRILTQHALGPRKSLMIVRVAGESLLLGVTDQNISILKSLSLIDEEIPSGVLHDFSQSMDEADVKNRDAVEKIVQKAGRKTEADVDEFVLGNIQDTISIKLKGMRDL